ncbi:MAG: trypsin-like peptidase domain-containing protein [Deltaproteobacteria bacterium]|nr:trypsin-like peptidase domain-containing protein [Deltaproteobacteria bacterium]
MGRGARLLLPALLGLAAACGRGTAGSSAEAGDGASAPLPPPPPLADTAEAGPPRDVQPLPSLAPLVERVRPSVVNIIAEVQVAQPVRGPYGRYGYVPRTVSNSLGSGFIIDAEGHVLTNSHVIGRANVISVQLDDGREIPAKLVGMERRVDLAVLDIDVEGLQALELGDSGRVQVGDYVVAIGNPFGLSNTVTAGIVSALGREVTSEVPGYSDFIQTDASINTGNSGGPLVDLQGRVIGINTMISAEGQGIGFAVPINMVKQVLPQILAHGSVARSWLGLWWRELDAKTARTLGLAVPPGQGSRVMVVDVMPDGPAALGGLRPNDVVLSFDGRAIDRPSLFPWIASTAPVGRPVELEVWRDGRAERVSVVPMEVPE